MRERQNGFTLLEVMVAIAILALFLVPLLGGVISGLSSIERSRNYQTARQLALTKLEEIMMQRIPEMEIEESGDFSPEYPDYKWRATFQKREELRLLEEQIVGLKTMEILLMVSWEEAGQEKSLTITSLMAK